MRKFLTRSVLIIAVMTAGIGMTSCDNEVIQSIIDILVGGKSYTYRGTYTMQLYGPNPQSGKLVAITDVAKYTDTSVQVTASNSATGNSSTAKITVPGTEFAQGVTMSDVTLSSLSLNNNNLSVSQTTQGTGTLTLNGTQLNMYAAEINGTVTSENLRINQLVLYFGDEGDYAVEITFVDGRVITTN